MKLNMARFGLSRDLSLKVVFDDILPSMDFTILFGWSEEIRSVPPVKVHDRLTSCSNLVIRVVVQWQLSKYTGGILRKLFAYVAHCRPLAVFRWHVESAQDSVEPERRSPPWRARELLSVRARDCPSLQARDRRSLRARDLPSLRAGG